MACPEVLRQLVIAEGVPAVLQHIKEVTGELKDKALKASNEFEGDEKDFHTAKQLVKHHDVICDACGKT